MGGLGGLGQECGNKVLAPRKLLFKERGGEGGREGRGGSSASGYASHLEILAMPQPAWLVMGTVTWSQSHSVSASGSVTASLCLRVTSAHKRGPGESTPSLAPAWPAQQVCDSI